MNKRAHNIIHHLIKNEMTKRRAYQTVFKTMPRNFSYEAIVQMKQIVKGKKLPIYENQALLAAIEKFERLTRID